MPEFLDGISKSLDACSLPCRASSGCCGRTGFKQKASEDDSALLGGGHGRIQHRGLHLCLCRVQLWAAGYMGISSILSRPSVS